MGIKAGYITGVLVVTVVLFTACGNKTDIQNAQTKETTAQLQEAESDTQTESTEDIIQESTTKQSVDEQEITTEQPDNEQKAIQNTEASEGVMSSMTTAEIIRDMGIGINLGNTFEACGDWITENTVTAYETAWGSPVITKEMIAGLSEEGFGVVRIPVAWSNMMGEDYTISSEYMARVKEVVDWTIDSGMYAIINIHWDGGWWEQFPTDKAECMKKYTVIWTQITNEFADYDEKLIFESLNEEGCWDSVWNRYGNTTVGKQEAYGLLNEINQTFVDLVRASGGNNKDRHLLIAGYATDITLTCDSYFEMPEDAKNRCAVSVHYYTPASYCIITEDTDWAKAQKEWGSDADKAELDKNLKLLNDTFVSKGIPVIIGEFGVMMDNKTKENAILFLTSVAEKAYGYGMCPVLWDTTSAYSFYNRYTCRMSEYGELKEAFIDIVKEN